MLIISVIISYSSGWRTLLLPHNEVVGAEQGCIWRCFSGWGHPMGWLVGSGSRLHGINPLGHCRNSLSPSRALTNSSYPSSSPTTLSPLHSAQWLDILDIMCVYRQFLHPCPADKGLVLDAWHHSSTASGANKSLCHGIQDRRSAGRTQLSHPASPCLSTFNV